ncbi:MAG: vWA domain-containing protein, partial [Candidatus Delongbacteria bacterium]
MPKKDHTQLICVLDRSGSMESVADDAIGGFNTFIEEQKKQPGTMSVTLVLFDHEYLVPFKNKDIMKVEPLNRKSYVPRGVTALLDAVGRTVNEAGSELSKKKEKDRPEKVIVCILTDGLENASKEFKIEQIKKLIEHQKEKYSWDFVFLAANQDAF